MTNRKCPFCGSKKVQKHEYASDIASMVPVMIECLTCGASVSFQMGEDAFDERKVWVAYNMRAE